MLVWCRPYWGLSIVNRKLCPKSSGWAVILLGMAVLALAGCGRKGGLDLPPGAANTPTASAAAAPTDAQTEAASKPNLFNSSGPDVPPTAPRGPKRPFILDPLLGN